VIFVPRIAKSHNQLQIRKWPSSIVMRPPEAVLTPSAS